MRRRRRRLDRARHPANPLAWVVSTARHKALAAEAEAAVRAAPAGDASPAERAHLEGLIRG